MIDATSATRDEGILALAMPALAREVWVADDVLATRLAASGYDIVEESPDVALVTSHAELDRAPDAPAVVAILDGVPPGQRTRGRASAAMARLHAHARLRRCLGPIETELHSRGFGGGRVLLWDDKMTLDLSGRNRVPLTSSQRYPRRALVTAGDVTTLLDQALIDAGHKVDGEGSPAPLLHWVAVSEGSVVAICDLGALRLGLGAGRGQVRRPAQSLRALVEHARQTPLESLLPAIRATGDLGPLAWSVESLMDGERASQPLPATVWDDCVDALADLRTLPSHGVVEAVPLPELGARIAELTTKGDTVCRLAERAEQHLEPLRAGVNHGDFWSENLLVDQGRLSGIIDWDSATGRGLPFVDLFHMFTTEHRRRGFDKWGQAFTERLLPWSLRASDPRLLKYAARIELEPTPVLMHRCATAYWFSHVGYQVSRYAQRSQDEVWLRKNVDHVAEALVATDPSP